jgi:hypothetical protein
LKVRDHCRREHNSYAADLFLRMEIIQWLRDTL